MVSKLLLAVQECCIKAVNENENSVVVGKLLEHFYEINAGIGVHKSPKLYGAFPTDPYSHTPGGKGAQQPGMTGQVKEDILSRFGELGVFVKQGKLYFNPCLLRKVEFFKEPADFNYIDLLKNRKTIKMEKDSLGFTYCQVPIVYQMGVNNKIEVHRNDASITTFDSLALDKELSDQLFNRTGVIEKIVVKINKDVLK
jgi:hypothetical protein